jgi:predicted  nucleic acid-binding Zn-ribbon protein
LKDELAALEELQILDLKILKQSTELTTIPENLEVMRDDVAHIGEILEREKERLAEAEQWREDREKDVALQNELLNKSKSKLQSVRNEKENKAAQREIEAIRKTIQDREEEAIKLMEAIDQYRAAIDKHATEFAELEAQLAERETEGAARISEIKALVSQSDDRRAALVERVPDKTYRLYERIRKRLGAAVVEAEEGHCTGCNMDIRAQMYNELQRGDKIYQCSNCFRILIYKEPPESEDTAEE